MKYANKYIFKCEQKLLQFRKVPLNTYVFKIITNFYHIFQNKSNETFSYICSHLILYLWAIEYISK